MTITLNGSTGLTQPADNLAGSSSGTVTIKGAANAGTWTMILPTTAGLSGQSLQTDGTGVTTWATPAGGGGTSTGSNIFLADYFGGF